MPFIADLTWYLANVQAINLQKSLESILEETPMEPELMSEPITAKDMLQTVPVGMRKHLAGEHGGDRWMPPRAEKWMDRLCEMYPEFQEIEEEARAALHSDNPEEGFALIRRKIYESESA